MSLSKVGKGSPLPCRLVKRYDEILVQTNASTQKKNTRKGDVRLFKFSDVTGIAIFSQKEILWKCFITYISQVSRKLLRSLFHLRCLQRRTQKPIHFSWANSRWRAVGCFSVGSTYIRPKLRGGFRGKNSTFPGFLFLQFLRVFFELQYYSIMCFFLGVFVWFASSTFKRWFWWPFFVENHQFFRKMNKMENTHSENKIVAPFFWKTPFWKADFLLDTLPLMQLQAVWFMEPVMVAAVRVEVMSWPKVWSRRNGRWNLSVGVFWGYHHLWKQPGGGF